MIKSSVTYFLLTLMLIHSFSQVVITVDYLVNQESITEKYCVNKDKPQLNCKGKCHLSKELKKDTERKTEGQITTSEILLFCENIYSVQLILGSTATDRKTNVFCYKKRVTTGVPGSIFHPPKMFV